MAFYAALIGAAVYSFKSTSGGVVRKVESFYLFFGIFYELIYNQGSASLLREIILSLDFLMK